MINKHMLINQRTGPKTDLDFFREKQNTEVNRENIFCIKMLREKKNLIDYAYNLQDIIDRQTVVLNYFESNKL
jgi:hypothetical protein